MTAIESQLNSFLKVAEGTLEMNVVIAQFDDLPSQVLHLLRQVVVHRLVGLVRLLQGTRPVQPPVYQPAYRRARESAGEQPLHRRAKDFQIHGSLVLMFQCSCLARPDSSSRPLSRKQRFRRCLRVHVAAIDGRPHSSVATSNAGQALFTLGRSLCPTTSAPG